MHANEQRGPDALDVLHRLSRDVDYTRIKMIFLDLPSSLSTLTWQEAETGDTLLKTFAGKTARAIERQLRRVERALPTMDADVSGRNRERVRMLRHELVQFCFHEVNRSSAQELV